MENLHELNEKYKRSVVSWRKREKKIHNEIEILRGEIEALEKRKNNLSFSSLEKSLKPLLEEIKKRLKAEAYEKYGPFGMCSEISFYWKKNKDKSITDKGNVLGSLTLISYGKGWAIRNENKKVNNYPDRSIAGMNGMNYETIEITEDMNIEWLTKFVKRKR